jgi:hypothetical protein
LADRILTYLLLPFGEEGHTNLGKIIATAGSVTVPTDVSTIHLNIEHDDIRPVGRAVQVDETPDGIVASFRVARTTAGDDLLVETEDGLRSGISVELDDPIIRAGRLIKALLTGAGAVTEPAFHSAQLIAADAGEMKGTNNMDPLQQAIAALEEATQLLKDAQTPADVTEAVAIVEDALVPVTEPNAPSTTDPMLARQARLAAAQAHQALNAVAPTLVAASATRTTAATLRAVSAPAGLRPAPRNTLKAAKAHDVFTVLAQAYRAGGERKLLAALSDVVPGDILGVEQPQFVGELWSGRAYQRRIIPLFNHASLTSFKVLGWQWVTKPVVSAYQGNKNQPPSAGIETEQVSIDAARLAGAHDIDRKFRDFNDVGFWEAYYKAMTESYAQVSDYAVLAAAIAAAGGATPGGTVPTGVSAGMAQIVDGAVSVLTTSNALPTFAIVAPDLWRDILLTRSDDVLTYLNAALSLEDGTIQNFKIVPHSGMTAAQVLVGAGEAMTVHELGEVPIRVEAENIALGGIDAGVFGYYAVNVHDGDALALISANGSTTTTTTAGTTTTSTTAG